MSAKVWNPDIMLSQKRAMDACLANIEACDARLLDALSAYARVVRDNVSDEAKALVKRIGVLVEEMREEVGEKIGSLERAAKLQNEIESNARSGFRG